MIGLAFRDELPDAIQREMDHLIGQLRGFLSISFNEDGTLQTGSQDFNVVPTGSIMPYGGSTAPDGWYLCDGSQKSRVDDNGLFQIIGTTYGIGDGSTTFNLPDLRQRFPLGKAASGTGATLGTTGGAIDHTHTFSATTGIESSTQVAASGVGAGCAANNHTHTVSGTSGTNNAPFQVVNYIILANRRTV